MTKHQRASSKLLSFYCTFYQDEFKNYGNFHLQKDFIISKLTNLYVFIHLCARRLLQLIFLALEQPSKNKISSKNVEIIWKKGPLSTSKYYLLILAAPNLTRIFLINGAIKESHLFFRSKFLSQSWRTLKYILNDLK